jgi:UPF0716 protein FxsA
MNYFILLLLLFPIIEIVLLIKVGGSIGILNTILLILVTGALGAVLARIQGFIILQKIAENLNRGVMPSREILDGGLVLAGAICLLDPGIIGDLVGFVLLLPWTRALVRWLLMRLIRHKLDRGEVITIRSTRSYPDQDELSG